MADVKVARVKSGDEWHFEVTITEDRSATHHKVVLKPADFHSLVGGAQVNSETLIQRSFEFLLEREPKESIMRTFNLMVINSHFPEYEQEIKRRLGLH